jgi:hypothetical protein
MFLYQYCIAEFAVYARAVYQYMMLLSEDEKKANEIIPKWWNVEVFVSTRLLILHSDIKKAAPVKAAKDEGSKFKQEQDAKLADMAERKRKALEDADEEKESRKKMAAASGNYLIIK